MAKVIKFPVPTPEKFGPQRVRKKGLEKGQNPGQLNLFNSGSTKIIRLHQLTPFEVALMHDEQGDVVSARTAYLKAIEENDCVADAFCNLGILEWQVGNAAKAIDSFTRCLELAPRHYEAHYNLANVYAEVGNLALAKIHYEIAIEIEPSFCNCYFNLALTLAMNRQFNEAIKILHEYRNVSPDENHSAADELISKLSMV